MPLTRTNSSAKRKRVITACVECHRRKQKCDRKAPCNVCLARNVAEKCSYTHFTRSRSLSPSSDEKVPAILNKRKREEENGDDESIEQASKQLDLSDQTGYSLRNDSNVFVGLQKSLAGTDGQPAGSLRPSESLLIAYLKDKFCNIVAQLPPKEALVDLVDYFFAEANSHAEVLERYYFTKLYVAWQALNESISEKVMLSGVSRELLYFPALLFQTLAVGAQYLPLDSVTANILGLKDWSAVDEHSQRFSQYGLRIMSLLGRHSSTVTAIQHDLLRAFWLKNCSRGTESWYILGDAIRQAQDLGLHLHSEVHQSIHLEDTLERLWYDEYKRRLWVSLFNWDAHMALILGRPRTINAGDCTIKPPLDCNMPLNPSQTVPETTGPADMPSTYTKFLHTYQLSYKTHEMLSLGADKRYVKDYGVVIELHHEVLALLDALPPVVRPKNTDFSWDEQCPNLPKQRESILTSTYSFLTALHRPHVAVHESSRNAAIEAAVATLDSQQRLFSMMTSSHYRTFALSFYTLDAALFLATALIEHAPQDEKLLNRIHHAIRQGIQRLEIVKIRSPMAESGVRLLSRCYESTSSARLPPSEDRGKDARRLELEQSNPTATALISPPLSAELDSKTFMTLSPPLGQIDWWTKPQAFSTNGMGNLGDNSSSNSMIIPTNYDSIGNATDFQASFWTEQMSQILNSNPGMPGASGSNDPMWEFFLA